MTKNRIFVPWWFISKVLDFFLHKKIEMTQLANYDFRFMVFWIFGIFIFIFLFLRPFIFLYSSVFRFVDYCWLIYVRLDPIGERRFEISGMKANLRKTWSVQMAAIRFVFYFLLKLLLFNFLLKIFLCFLRLKIFIIFLLQYFFT